MFNFDEFAEKVKNEIEGWLPEGTGPVDVKINDVQKINESYKALIVSRENDPIAPSINLNEVYKDYMDHGDFGRSMMTVAELSMMRPEGLETRMFEDYEMAKNNLFIRVSNVDQNREYLESIPHKEVDGLAITYHLLAEVNGEAMGSTVITNDLMDKFGISEEQLHEDALANSVKILAPDFEPMTNMIGRMMGIEIPVQEPKESFEEKVRETDFTQESMFVLTNRTSINGAAVIFYPEVLETIGEQMQGNYFIIPSSTHEVLIVPEDGVYDYKDLEKIVRDINANEVAPKDFLSNSVYHYDSTEHVFERAATFEERSQEKAQEKTSVKDRLLSEAKEQCRAQDCQAGGKSKEHTI